MEGIMEIVIPLFIVLFGSGTFLAARQIRIKKIDQELSSAQYKIYNNGRIIPIESPPLTPVELDNQMVKNIDVAEVATLTTLGAIQFSFLVGKKAAALGFKVWQKGIKDVMDKLATPEEISDFGFESFDVLSQLTVTQPGELLVEHIDSLLANGVEKLVSVGLPKVLRSIILNEVVKIETLLSLATGTRHLEAYDLMLEKIGKEEVLDLEFLQEIASKSEEVAEIIGGELIESGVGIPFVSIGFGLFRFMKRNQNNVDLNRNVEFTTAEVGSKLTDSTLGLAIGSAVLPGIGSAIGAVAGSILGGSVGNKIKSRHFERETKIFQQKMIALQNQITAFDKPYSKLLEADLNYRIDLSKLGYELLEHDTLMILRKNLADMIERYRAYDEGLTNRFRSQSIWSWFWPSKSDLALRQLYKSRQPVSQIEQKLRKAINHIQEVENTEDAAQVGLYVYQNKALHPFIPKINITRRAQQIDRAKADWENPTLRADVVRHRDLIVTAEGETAQAYELVLKEAKQLNKKLQPYESFFAPAPT